MSEWLTPPVAVGLMYTGVVPSLVNVYLLYDDRRKSGVLWFLALMATAGLWAFLYATFTLVQSPRLTLALANLFWATVPTAAVTMFLLAYEYVFRTTASNRLVVALFVPVAALFLLSWTNPANLVFTPAYRVGPDGVLYVPPIGGPVKFLVTKVYGYLLASFAAGMFVGEALRTSGPRRRQTLSLLLILSAVAASTLVKILGLVPEYFDPTSVAFSVSGVVFAYSIHRHGLLKAPSVAWTQAFQTVDEVVLVTDADGVVAETNRAGRDLFGEDVVGTPLTDLLGEGSAEATEGERTVRLAGGDGPRYFSVHTSSVAYGRGVTGRLVVLTDVTTLKRRQDELDLLNEILTRVFRHNMRNDLNVIEGNAERIRAVGGERVADLTETISERVRRLLEQSEKAQEIARTFAREETVQLSLREAVENVLEVYAARSDAAVRSTVEDVTVEVHPQFGLALRELLENAVTHHDAEGPLEITVSTEVGDDWVTLLVTDNGPGIPEQEIAVLEAREETSLQHASGIGLWLVELVVSRSGGHVDIDSDAEGTRVAIRLRRGETAP